MLFLAVFTGMLAEYRLEHIIEHQREKKYVRSLIRDTELDLTSLQTSYNNRKQQISYFDSLRILLQTGYQSRMNDFYFYARHITRAVPFRYHDRTIQQLKNSGNLRLIRNQNAADSITVYDSEKMRSCLLQLENEDQLRKFFSYNLAGKFFDAFAWHNMTDSSGRIIRLTNNPPLLTGDSALLNELSFKVVTLRGTLAFTNRLVAETMTSARSLIELLKNEYKLK